MRDVNISPEGDLFVEWTGYFAHRQPVAVGVKTGKTRWLAYDPEHRGKKLAVWRVTLPEKIGDRITLRIPKGNSFVEFKDVAISRLKPLKD